MASTVGGVSAAHGTGMGSMVNGPVLGYSREMAGWAEPNCYSGHAQGKGKQSAGPGVFWSMAVRKNEKGIFILQIFSKF
jgi:hypothetical protein